MNETFSIPCRIYIEDTDAGGVVYYANYLKFAERARTEWLRSFGFDQVTLMQDHNIAFVVKHCSIDYRQPARLDDVIAVTVAMTQLGASKIEMQQDIFKGDQHLARLQIVLATVNTVTGRAVRLPDILRAKIKYGGLK